MSRSEGEDFKLGHHQLFCSHLPRHLKLQVNNQQLRDRPDIRDKVRPCLRIHCNNWWRPSRCTLMPWLRRF
jgi:hypothetical protein